MMSGADLESGFFSADPPRWKIASSDQPGKKFVKNAIFCHEEEKEHVQYIFF